MSDRYDEFELDHTLVSVLPTLEEMEEEEDKETQKRVTQRVGATRKELEAFLEAVGKYHLPAATVQAAYDTSDLEVRCEAVARCLEADKAQEQELVALGWLVHKLYRTGQALSKEDLSSSAYENVPDFIKKDHDFEHKIETAQAVTYGGLATASVILAIVVPLVILGGPVGACIVAGLVVAAFLFTYFSGRHALNAIEHQQVPTAKKQMLSAARDYVFFKPAAITNEPNPAVERYDVREKQSTTRASR